MISLLQIFLLVFVAGTTLVCDSVATAVTIAFFGISLCYAVCGFLGYYFSRQGNGGAA